jgi:hypothetical protein
MASGLFAQPAVCKMVTSRSSNPKAESRYAELDRGRRRPEYGR